PDSFSGFLDHEYDPNHSLLTDVESQSIADFFSNTDPFHLAEPHQYHQPADAKDTIDGFSDWANFVTPATVHGVSTSIPDQAHLQNNFYNDHTYAQPPPPAPASHLANTQDDLQAASALFHNSQSSYAQNRSHSFQTPAIQDPPPTAHETSTLDQSGKPLRITPHGLINEQLAALIPNHNEEGTLDSQFAAQWVGTNAINIEDEPSDEATSDDDDEDEKPSKKRRKSKVAKDSHRRGIRNGKGRKASTADESGKKKRSAAAQKLQRENLTEEQKRSNHILSEQKRRNLIKRGFDDLHDLVPEIRNGGLSKSSVLTEAANFLDKLIEENKTFKKLMGG
ncbi:hypothetical protein DE146DRAFT_613022, partial [Phaeosphaeria sp. MPI-PUGE-AT-0046c]